MDTKQKKRKSYPIESNDVKSTLSRLLVSNEVARAIIMAWLSGKGVDVPQGMTPRVECEFNISIVPIPPNQNGNVE